MTKDYTEIAIANGAITVKQDSGMAIGEILFETEAQLNATIEQAIAEAQTPVGWKLMPIEPTPKMLCALWEHRDAMRGQSENKIARISYTAMLNASPPKDK